MKPLQTFDHTSHFYNLKEKEEENISLDKSMQCVQWKIQNPTHLSTYYILKSPTWMTKTVDTLHFLLGSIFFLITA